MVCIQGMKVLCSNGVILKIMKFHSFEHLVGVAIQCGTTDYYHILMAKTQGFYKVVRASAVTHRKLQISKVVTPPIPD
jgi:hypothetical protein